MKKKALLCIVPYQLYPPDHGGNVFIWNKLQALSGYYDIHVLSPEPGNGTADRGLMEKEFESRFQGHAFFPILTSSPKKLWLRTASYYRWIFLSTKPGVLGPMANSGLERRVESYVREHDIDFLLVEHGYTALALERLRDDAGSAAAKVPWLVVEHNVESRLARDGSLFKNYSLIRRFAQWWESKKMRRAERRIHQLADGFLYISEQDKKYFERPGYNSHLAAVTTIAKPIAIRKENFSPAGRIIFFGTLEFFPNFDGLIWFVTHVWPLILLETPKAKLVVAGAFSPKLGVLLQRIPSLELPGTLSNRDLDRVIADCDVFISPLRLGSGIKIKNIVAMNLAMPIVATSKSFEGIPVRPGTDLLIADTAKSFAEAVTSLLRSEELRRSLSSHIYEQHQNIYRPDRAVETWITAIDHLLSSPTHHDPT
jgi:glycosyltransferase involved in cell wall biosynthesis